MNGNSNWIAGLNIKSKSVKLLENNVGEYYQDIDPCKEFLGPKRKEQKLQQKSS